ncbi:Invasion protein IalB, involved in pathogenesis [Jannaschia faecimaris]|uniref:Invasion protein IalB, involved in pathogenesis n=1 Tax=Jannaschia faecimaris TaxID=1244108 RepID=A0A1H3NZY8_9RHOB|nr:invasion associated locus B family protein [Jannaschia faecimaris]SDY94457.1 Invasion protein IalB, involved in pathogenesis [Jannaschia faecimaris]
MTFTPSRFNPALASALVLSMVLAVPSWAQDTATEEPAADTEQAPAAQAPVAPTPGGDLATGSSVGEALGGGPQIYVREEHGDWEVRCLEAPEGQEDPCQLYQRLADQQGNPTADVNFFDLPDGGDIVAGATILTPLQTLLTAQVTMSIDGGQPRRYPYSFCDATGCYSRMGFTAEDVAAFKRGAAATLVVVPALAPDQRAELTMSLSGFTAGLAAVEVANP